MHISVIGTGAIGSAFAEAFLKLGHDVTVANRSPGKAAPLVALGARLAVNANSAVVASDVILIALTDAKAMTSILETIEPSNLAGKFILNASSTRASEIEDAGRWLATKGAKLAEVTVNVGPDQIREGQGMYLLGCAPQDEDLWTTLLSSIGGVVHCAGELGSASRAELPLLLTYLFGLAASAYIAAIVAQDKTPDDILEAYVYPALPVAQYSVPHMIGRQFEDASASVDAFRGLAENASHDIAAKGLPVDILENIAALFERASASGFGAKDGAAVVEALYKR